MQVIFASIDLNSSELGYDFVSIVYTKLFESTFKRIFFQLKQLLLNTPSHCTLLIAIIFFIVHQ